MATGNHIQSSHRAPNSGFAVGARSYAGSGCGRGMTAGADCSDVEIKCAIGACSLGSILVAATDKGVCAIFLGDAPVALLRDLQNRFPRARLIGGGGDFERLVAKVVSFVEAPQRGLDSPLDIRGTAFQQRVWSALKEIPLGSTTTYAEIASRIGEPKSVRAVAGAIAANKIAVAIPCHRVLKTGGALSGYRWGVERKRRLLEREAL
jgi:AraC family transcriptional regulator, regulatory protein of adaptative response / methylated-DNA-[protein]-cysteine methyltransferase